MRKSLKNELSILSAVAGINCLIGKRYRTATLFGGIAAGMFLTSSSQRFTWKGKSVLITGGSRGLGLALARNLLNEGARVSLIARKFEELAKARQMLLNQYPNAEICTIICDVTKKDQLSRAIHETIDAFGVVDAIINNAGSITVGPLESMTKVDFEAQMKLHLYSVIDAVELLRPYFRERGGGRIINICSLGGKTAVPHMIPYNASKFALAGFSQGAAIELANENIKVTTVYPALMRTGSPIQAVFKGEHQKEFAWFEIADNIPGLSMSADVAAKKIIEASAEGKTELVLSVLGRLRVLSGALFPELVNSIMVMIGSWMPKGNSGVRQTGHQSRYLFDKWILTRPFRVIARNAEEKNNQTPGNDAEFNMGIN